MVESNNIFRFLFFVIAITLNSSLPLPSLPLTIFNYISNNFIFAFISTITGSVFASYIQYIFATRIYKLTQIKIFKKFKFFTIRRIGKKRNLLKKFAKKVRNTSYLDFFLFRLSAIFSFKITNVFCGLIRYPLTKFLLVTTLTQIPWNIIYYLAIKSNNLVGRNFTELDSSELDINILNNTFMNFIYSITLIYLISKLVSHLIKKYNNWIN